MSEKNSNIWIYGDNSDAIQWTVKEISQVFLFLGQLYLMECRAERQASLSITSSWSLLKLLSIS